jgi:hypothetical protein
VTFFLIRPLLLLLSSLLLLLLLLCLEFVLFIRSLFPLPCGVVPGSVHVSPPPPVPPEFVVLGGARVCDCIFWSCSPLVCNHFKLASFVPIVRSFNIRPVINCSPNTIARYSFRHVFHCMWVFVFYNAGCSSLPFCFGSLCSRHQLKSRYNCSLCSSFHSVCSFLVPHHGFMVL